MIQKSPAMIGNLMIAGATGAFILSTIFATVVFDKTSPNSTADIQEIELAMQVVPDEQHVEVWVDAVLPLHIMADIVNISKIDEEGNAEPGTITDLFPVSGPATGGGSVTFKIAVVDKSVMPYLPNFTQTVIPMAFIKASTYSEIVRSILKLGAVSLRWFSVIAWLTVLGGLGCIGAGGFLVFRAMKNAPPPPLVVSIE